MPFGITQHSTTVRRKHEYLSAPIIGVTRTDHKATVNQRVDERRDVRLLHDEANTQLTH
jgi:hypothetical protein